jgi:integrase
MRFHDLRHTCAAIAIDKGRASEGDVGPPRAQEHMITMDIYGHLFADKEDALADLFDRIFTSPQEQDGA